MNDLKFKLIPVKTRKKREKGIHPKNKPTNKYAPRTRLSNDISPLFRNKSPDKIKKKLTLSPLSFKNK